MTKRILALLLALALALALAACGGGNSPASSGTGASAADSSTAGEGSAPEAGSASQYPGLTDQEQEAVDAGLLRLDGSVPIITRLRTSTAK